MRRTRGRTSGRRDRSITLAAVLAAGIVSGAGLAPAAAQDVEGDDTGDDGATEPVDEAAAPAAEPLEIEASTLYVSPITDAIPPTLTTSVPPAMICVLQPSLCPERPDWYPDALPWREDVPALFGAIQERARDLPVQPVMPDTAAVSYLGGVTRYQTALKFDTPTVPEGEEVVRYELTFPQAQPSYDLSSPLFRRAILAVFETIADQDPAVLAEGLSAALAESPIDTSPVLAFEACPLLAPFEPGGAPLASHAGELPQHEDDGETVTAVDCTYGGNGVFDEDAQVWRVDLAFTVQAWAAGELDNHGVLLRPIGAPNLAFGDADTSTNAQLVLDLGDVTAAMESMEPFDPDDFAAPPTATDATLDHDPVDDPGIGVGDDLGGSDLPDPDPLGAPMGAPELPLGGDEALTADAPEVAADLAAAPEPSAAAQPARPAAVVASTPWWVWLTIPLLLAGAWLTGSSVLAPATVAGAAGEGALSRLLAKHGAGPATSPQR